eukprot:gene12026-14067_t
MIYRIFKRYVEIKEEKRAVIDGNGVKISARRKVGRQIKTLKKIDKETQQHKTIQQAITQHESEKEQAALTRKNKIQQINDENKSTLAMVNDHLLIGVNALARYMEKIGSGEDQEGKKRLEAIISVPAIYMASNLQEELVKATGMHSVMAIGVLESDVEQLQSLVALCKQSAKPIDKDMCPWIPRDEPKLQPTNIKKEGNKRVKLA